MSYQVKPEDVPAEFAYTLCLHVAEGSMEDITADIASILNAAIEAGLVVPASEAKVLRRALENLAMILASPERGVEKTVELWIDQARKELESET